MTVTFLMFVFLLARGSAQDSSATAKARPALKADRLLVVKSERKLYAFHGNEVLRVFDVGMGRVEGAKQREGDKRTPEGIYQGCQLRRSSRYHLAITIPYPTPEQRRLGYTGSDIEIHGLPHLVFGLENLLGPLLIRSHGTRGCVILTNSDMDALAGLTAFPVTVEIVAERTIAEPARLANEELAPSIKNPETY